MKPFNLEQAKAGKPVCTRNGEPARILCFDLKRNYAPIAAGITRDNKEEVYYYTPDGHFLIGADSMLDLMMAPVKHTRWINIYHNGGEPCTTSYLHHSCKEAMDNADGDSSYIATVKVEWEEE